MAHSAPPADVQLHKGISSPASIWADRRARWLLLAVVAGSLGLWFVADNLYYWFGLDLPQEMVSALSYLPEIGLLVWAVRSRRLNLSAMLARPRLGWRWLLLPALGWALWTVSSGTSMISEILFPPTAAEMAADAATAASPLLLVIVSMIVLPALVEETVFRGVVFERWNHRYRAGLALVGSAVFFGALHDDFLGAGPSSVWSWDCSTCGPAHCCPEYCCTRPTTPWCSS
ncbi:MAG: CPBP family intramembrane glutamic endopeptidase [Candidatus Nanopelagicales bacterium]